MARKKNKILELAKSRFNSCEEFYRNEYERGRSDVDFVLGEQWEDSIKSKRNIEGRPCLTENRLLAFTHQVINDIRQSRPAINVVPVDNNSDVETAKIMKGMIRNIETSSAADNVYDTAAWNAVTAGYGWVRINTRYVDDDSFDQEIELCRVPDFASVMLDPNVREMDGRDSEYGFVSVDMARDAFEANYPDADPMPFKDHAKNANSWVTENTVRVVEYFYKEYEEKTIYLLSDGGIVDSLAEGEKAVDERLIRIPTVKWCKLTHEEILEETEWLGQFIPLVPCYGEEVYQDGRRKCFSLISQAKDPQRRYNYWLTASTEIIALQPKMPYIGLAGQFKTAGNKWARANNETFAYLEFDAVRLPNGQDYANPPQRQPAPTGSPAMFQEMLNAADGIKATLGIFDASLGARGNETSGVAIVARQREGDNATFHFVDNLQTCIRQVGRILVDLIPKIYTGNRIVRIIGDDDKKMSVPLNQGVVKIDGGFAPVQEGMIPEEFFDMNAGKYDVIATVGPSYATKRQETANMLQAMLQAAPETFQLFGDIFLKNLDIAESEIMIERLKKLNPIMNDDENQQAAQMAQAQQALQAMQQQLMQMDEALKQKRQKDLSESQAEVEKTKAEVNKLQAETAKIVAEAAAMQNAGGLTPEHINEILMTIANLEEQSRDTADAVEIILSAAEAAQPEQSGEQGVTLPPESTEALLNPEQGETNE